MVRWRDLGAGARAMGHVVCAGGYWRDVLLRALFSRVFIGYVVLVTLLGLFGFFVVWGWLGDLGKIGPGAQLFGAWSVIAGAAVLLPLVLLMLLPYGYWVVLPPAARRLRPVLGLPPAAPNAEVRFGQFLIWTGPTLAAMVLAGGVLLFPLKSNAQLFAGIQLAVAVLHLACMTTMFVRAALAGAFTSEQAEAFVRASRWQRLLLWMPGLVLAGAMTSVATGLVGMLLAPLGLRSALPLLPIQFLLLTVVGIAFTGVLLRACFRFHGGVDPHPGGPAGEIARALRATRRDRRRRVLRGVVIVSASLGALACVFASVYLGRAALTDWYFARDAMYTGAAQALHVSGQPRFDMDGRSGRLRAGYIAYACSGRLDRAEWIHALGVTMAADHGRLLACAACRREQAGLAWLLKQHPEAPLDSIVSGPPGGPRTALQCAARDNDIALSRELVRRGALGRDPDGPTRALEIAAMRHHWEIVRLVLPSPRGLAGRASMMAFESAYAQGRDTPLAVLPQLVASGLPLVAQGGSPFHLAAMHHDLPLAQALIQHVGLAGAYLEDQQGARPWVHVLRKAETDGRPLSPDALQLLRALLPEERSVLDEMHHMVYPGYAPGALPKNWLPSVALVNDPGAREVLGPRVEFGRLPADPVFWWPFRGRPEAESFIRSLTLSQLFNAENPYSTSAGTQPKRLSEALAERGWSELAEEVHTALRGIRTRGEADAMTERRAMPTTRKTSTIPP